MSDALSDPRPSLSLAPLPASAGGWTCKRIDLVDDDHLRVRFETPDGQDHIVVSVHSKAVEGRVFARLEHVAVRYTGHISTRTPERVEQVRGLVTSVGESINARVGDLVDSGDAPFTIARAMGRRAGRRRIVFSRDALRGMLAPEIVEGVPLAGGWVLQDIYPSSYLAESTSKSLRLVLDFYREDDERRFLMTVGALEPGKRAFASSANLALSYKSAGIIDPEGIDALCTLVAFTLQLRDHEDLEFEFPDVDADVERQLLLTAAHDEEPAERTEHQLNLAISSECHQQCAFCSIKEVAPPVDGGDQVFARLQADLASNRKAGVRHLRINGYDPLTYSRILEVLSYALELGYDKADLFSPCTMLADETFFEQVAARLAEPTTGPGPLYGGAAPGHARHRSTHPAAGQSGGSHPVCRDTRVEGSAGRDGRVRRRARSGLLGTLRLPELRVQDRPLLQGRAQPGRHRQGDPLGAGGLP